MKISIITATYNSGKTIAMCVTSVQNQNFLNIEHIIIDGASKDNTLQVIKSIPNRVTKIVSEPDNGIYDAMNKGIQLATGDIIGILNSDDFFTSDNVLEKIGTAFEERNVDVIIGDVCFVNPKNLGKIVRYYSSKLFKPYMFRFGFMPAHLGVYIRSEFYKGLGLYKTDYKIAADFELLIRYLKVNKLRTKYIRLCVVTMRTGGKSTRNLKSNWILNKEIVRGCQENGIYTNMGILSMKYLIKIRGLIFPNRKK